MNQLGVIPLSSIFRVTALPLLSTALLFACGSGVPSTSSSGGLDPLKPSSSSSSSSGASSTSSGSPASDLEAYFSTMPCGVGYEAIGNGGWSACYRLADGSAACNVINNPFDSQTVLWQDGTPVDNVAHINSNDDASVMVVTTDGKAYIGRYNKVFNTPFVDSHVISTTGGKNPLCLLVGNASQKEVVCNNFGNLFRPNLPSGFNTVQLSSAYGLTCALNTSGEVYCWADGGNMGDGLASVIKQKPSKFPFDEPMVFVSAGQNSVCGVQKSGGLKCKFSFYDNRYLPAKEVKSLAETPDNLLPNIKSFHTTYGMGVAINKDGSAVYFPGETIISGVGTAVSAGGHRAAMSIVNSDGDVYVVSNGNASKVSTSAPARAASCSL